MGSKIIFDAPTVVLGDEGLVDICSFRLEIVLHKIGARFALNVP
jgi:hypothetical protein